MSISVYYPRNTRTKWECHLAKEDGRSLCGSHLSEDDWQLVEIGFITDDALCPICADRRASEPLLWNPPEEPKKRHIYIFRVLGSDLYKIGVAQDVFKRLATLRQSNPFLVIFIWHSKPCLSEDAFYIERAVHQLFENRRLQQPHQREWFKFRKNEVEQAQLVIADAVERALQGWPD